MFDENGHWIGPDQPSDSIYRDISPYLESVLRVATNALGLFAIGTPAKARKIEWGKVGDGNSQYVTTTAGAGGTLTNAETQVQFPTADAARLRVNMILRSVGTHNVTRPAAYNGYELLKVLSKGDPVGGLVTVAFQRDYGHSTAGETLPTYDAEEQFIIHGTPEYERSVATPNRWFGASMLNNYMQIRRGDLAVSATYQELETLGTVTQSLPEQIAQMTEEKMREFLQDVLYGKADADYPEGGYDLAGLEVPRSMNGAFTMVAAHGGVVSTAAAWNEDVLNDAIEELRAVGGISMDGSVDILCNPLRQRQAWQWDRDKIQISRQDTQRGGFVGSFMSDQGVNVRFNTEHYVHTSDFLMGDIPQFTNLRPLGTRRWFTFRYKNPGEDGDCAALLGEWSLEMRRSNKCFVVGFSLA